MLRQLCRLGVTYFIFIVLLDHFNPHIQVESSELLNYDAQKADSGNAALLDGKAGASVVPKVVSSYFNVVGKFSDLIA